MTAHRTSKDSTFSARPPEALADVFASARGIRAGAGSRAELERILVTLIERAHAAWPSVDVSSAGFVRYIAGHLDGRGEPEDLLTKLVAEDLFLAFGCAEGDAHALEAFERAYLARVPAYLHRVHATGVSHDEVRQALREKLFVGGKSTGPAIRDYAGRGSLDGWVRLAAVRMALFLGRGESRKQDLAHRAARMPVPTPDPELEIIRQRYRGTFESAFREAFASLPSRQRTLLRLRFLDGVGVSEIATMMGVHRATITRWVSEAQEAAFAEARRRLQDRLSVDTRELDSLLRVVQSRLDVTFHSLLSRTSDRDGNDSEP
jgi:RNA polymerase sigma-70 factor (ECF subfamily)